MNGRGISILCHMALLPASLAACSADDPSRFRSIVSPRELAGVYRNEMKSPSPGNTTLWTLLHPAVDKQAPEIARDQFADSVAVDVGDNGKVTVRLMREGKIIAEQSSDFQFRPTEGCMARSTFGALTRNAPPATWFTRGERVDFGFEKGSTRLMVARSVDATMWVLIFPAFGSGGGPPTYFMFEPVGSAPSKKNGDDIR